MRGKKKTGKCFEKKRYINETIYYLYNDYFLRKINIAVFTEPSLSAKQVQKAS